MNSPIFAQVNEQPREVVLPQKRIGVLIVAYNAVTTLTKVLRRIPQKVWEMVEEVAVFDDASKDDTFELGLGFKAIAGLEKLTIIKNTVNLGYGGNQKQGYHYFINKGFDIVILLHGDGQYAPEILEEMYLPLIKNEADAVFGSRMLSEHGGALKGGMPLYKYVGNKILTFFENKALGMNLTEFHSGYRAYSLSALKQIDMSKMTDDFHYDTEIIIKLHHQGFRITEIPIPTYYGDEICYVNGMKYARDVFWSVVHYKKTLSSVAKYPEYSEYFIHYPIKDSKYSSHYYFQRLAGSNNDILDIGCGEGYFAERIAQSGNRTIGIDLLPEVKQMNFLSGYIQADLEQGLSNARQPLEGCQFDKILLQDVLEHLRNPEILLKDCAQFLKPNGQVLISVPNVANLTVRLSLLLGIFQYAERGILDKTHVRFFTRRTARKLIEACGYEVQQSFMTIMPLELVLGLSPHNPFMRAMAQILKVLTWLMPGLFGYQSIFVVAPRRDSAL
jgi:2-polyprenyl-3-methyl-5-hydroxy-6-metoxy-1,4-benzoquinol methylase